MLLPALSKAKQKAARTACLNNLKQLLLATHLYAGDSEDYLPWSNRGLDLPGWAYDVSNPTFVTNDMANQLALLKKGQLYPYAGDPAIYRCPADRTNGALGSLFRARPEVVTSYEMNEVVVEYGQRTNTFKLGQFPASAFLFFEPDENLPDTFDEANAPPCKILPTARHGPGPLGQFGGSVTFLSQRQWFDEAGQFHGWAANIPLSALPNRFWCNPNDPKGVNPLHPHP
jgi:hypothetical protein